MPECHDEKSTQAQKVQDIRQLAGGTAHDFSNLLTPIIGSCDLLLQNGALKQADGKELEGVSRSLKRHRCTCTTTPRILPAAISPATRKFISRFARGFWKPATALARRKNNALSPVSAQSLASAHRHQLV